MASKPNLKISNNSFDGFNQNVVLRILSTIFIFFGFRHIPLAEKHIKKLKSSHFAVLLL